VVGDALRHHRMRDLQQDGPAPAGEQHPLAMDCPRHAGVRDTIGEVGRAQIGHGRYYAAARKLGADPGRCVGVTPHCGKESAMRRAVPFLATALLLAVLVVPVAALEVGQKAPDFTLAAPGGKQVKLSDLTAKGPVVIFTFIQAFTGT
jgi:hypothetical protein